MWNDPRPTHLQINLKAIRHNYRYLSRYVTPKVVIPVVKADAYGHGAVEVVGALIKEDVKIVAVSLVEEALELRAHYKNLDILLMGPTLPHALKEAAHHNFIVTIYDESMIRALKTFDEPIRVHLKVDTGMHRLGFLTSQALTAYETLTSLPNVRLEGLYTHFATADTQDDLYVQQRKSFHDIIQQTSLPTMIHAANTEASLRDEKDDPYTTHVRVGLGLYGVCSEPHKHDLNPTLTWHTQVAAIKTITPSSKVGYGGTFKTKTHEKIALLPVGYADGLWRAHQNYAVSIRETPYPIVGRISMDQTTVLVDDQVSIHDAVVLLGAPHCTIYDLAKRVDTIPYEIFTSLSKRVPRNYIE